MGSGVLGVTWGTAVAGVLVGADAVMGWVTVGAGAGFVAAGSWL